MHADKIEAAKDVTRVVVLSAILDDLKSGRTCPMMLTSQYPGLAYESTEQRLVVMQPIGGLFLTIVKRDTWSIEIL